MIEENIKKLGISIPDAPAPVGAYVAFKSVGKFLYISGQISLDSNGKLIKGKVGKDIDLKKGQEAAKFCAINIIAQAKKACNEDLEKIANCIKITGFVNSSDDFIDLLRRMKYLESVSAYDSAMFNKYNEQLNQFNSRKEALLHAKGKLLLFKDAAEIKKREVSAKKLKKTQFLARLGKEKLLNKRLKDELVQSSKKLNRST